MTHGEQTKAKAGKANQASGKKTSSKTGGKAVQGGKTGKETGKAAKIVVKKDQAGPEKGSAAAQKGSSSAKEAGNGGKGKTRPAAPDAVPGFSNPTVANAFKRAVKKYPNAFRKLTD